MTRLLALVLVLVAMPVLAGTPTAFVNVNVIPMSAETVLAEQTVIVRGGRIEIVGSVDTTPIPDGARVVDGTDRFLMPGLAEMHAHVPEAGTPALDRYFNLYVANGVTTVRGMLGRPSHLGLRADLESGAVFVNGPADSVSPRASRTSTALVRISGRSTSRVAPCSGRDS